MKPVTAGLISGAGWLAKRLGWKPGDNPVGPPPPSGRPEEPCHEGRIGELKQYKWLAVPRSRLHEFALGGKVSSAADFMEAWREMASRNPQAGTQYATVVVCLTAAQDRYPDHTILVVDVA